MCRLILIIITALLSFKNFGQNFVYFEKNSFTLNEHFKVKLDSIITLVKQGNPLEEIALRGHTDKDAGEQYNKSLSFKRACVVREYFIEKGLKNKIHIDSKGETELVNSNNNESDKAKNRRVEIILNYSTDNLVFERFNKEYQIFTINSKKDTVLKCSSGTEIRIKKNSIETYNDPADVTIKVQEFYSKKDFILSNLTTHDVNNALLESGGMINIEAYQGDKRLELKNTDSLGILFKNKKVNDRMEMFNGVKHNDQVIWSNSVHSTSTIVSMNSYTLIMGERVSESKSKYETINGQKLKITETKEKGKTYYDTVSVESEALTNDLWLNTNRFGWINCDRFYKYETPKIDIVVQYSGSFVPNVVAVFKDINSILPYSYREDNKLVFKNVPSNQEITFIGIQGTKNKEKIFFAEKKSITKSAVIENIIFKELLPIEVEQRMKTL